MLYKVIETVTIIKTYVLFAEHSGHARTIVEELLDFEAIPPPLTIDTKTDYKVTKLNEEK